MHFYRDYHNSVSQMPVYSLAKRPVALSTFLLDRARLQK
jgi:hypothetical protein